MSTPRASPGPTSNAGAGRSARRSAPARSSGSRTTSSTRASRRGATEALERGYRAAVALPLKDEADGVFGALSIYAGERDAFTAEEVRLLEQLAADLAFGILVLRQREARKRIEALLQANLRFFEGMDQVNRAIQETSDLDAMMGRVLELALALFGCDRAWLLHPCDPEAPRLERADGARAAGVRRGRRSARSIA